MTAPPSPDQDPETRPELPWSWAHRDPICQQCGGPLPEDSSPGRRYCSSSCRATAHRPARKQAELDQVRALRRGWKTRRRA